MPEGLQDAEAQGEGGPGAGHAGPMSGAGKKGLQPVA